MKLNTHAALSCVSQCHCSTRHGTLWPYYCGAWMWMFIFTEAGWTVNTSWLLTFCITWQNLTLPYITLHPTRATLPTLQLHDVSHIRYYNVKLLFDGTVLNIKPEVQWEQVLLLFISAHIQFCMMTGQTYHELYCWWLHIQNLKCWLMLAANAIM